MVAFPPPHTLHAVAAYFHGNFVEFPDKSLPVGRGETLESPWFQNQNQNPRGTGWRGLIFPLIKSNASIYQEKDFDEPLNELCAKIPAGPEEINDELIGNIQVPARSTSTKNKLDNQLLAKMNDPDKYKGSDVTIFNTPPLEGNRNQKQETTKQGLEGYRGGEMKLLKWLKEQTEN